MPTRSTNCEHEDLYQDLCRLLDKHTKRLTRPEILAVASNMLGKLVALQDNTVMSSEEAMEIVVRNLQIGNQQAVERLLSQTAGSA